MVTTATHTKAQAARGHDFSHHDDNAMQNTITLAIRSNYGRNQAFFAQDTTGNQMAVAHSLLTGCKTVTHRQAQGYTALGFTVLVINPGTGQSLPALAHWSDLGL